MSDRRVPVPAQDGDLSLTGPTLRVRIPRLGDAADLVRHASDPEVTRWFSWGPYESADDALAYLERLPGERERGELSLFRTLESLAIGVQGKRCMWRALESLLGDQPIPSARSLGGLEAMAVRQWEAIEERRRALVGETFPALRLSAMDVPID